MAMADSMKDILYNIKHSMETEIAVGLITVKYTGNDASIIF